MEYFDFTKYMGDGIKLVAVYVSEYKIDQFGIIWTVSTYLLYRFFTMLTGFSDNWYYIAYNTMKS